MTGDFTKEAGTALSWCGKASAPRVLYLPNEIELGGQNQQVGGRAAFLNMEKDGTLGALGIYSFLGKFLAAGSDAGRGHRDLLEAIRAFQPDILFWSHPGTFPVTVELLAEIRRCGSDPLIIYHEGDPFDRFYKTLHAPQRILYRGCDVFFTVGLGAGLRLFEELSPKQHIYHAPSYTEPERFATPAPEGKIGSRFDAVMIGNIARRFRVFKHPGSAERIQLGKGLSRLFGDRFASFGRGWPTGTNNHGSLRHVQQVEILQSSRMSLIWEHFPDYTFYYSDRLPIALAAGVPFITSYRPGYDILFKNVPGLFCAGSVNEVLDIAIYLRSLPLEALIEMGRGGRDWVVEHLNADAIFRRMTSVAVQCWRQRSLSTRGKP